MRSDRQSEVYVHPSDVKPLHPSRGRKRAWPRRYQLHGWDCTRQVTGLVVRGLVVERPDGKLVDRARESGP